MKIFESEYLQIDYESNKKIFISTWTNSENLVDEILQNHLLSYKELVAEYQPKGVFIKNFNYPIIPQMQTWITENIDNHPSQESIEKVAFLVSPEFYAQLSLEQFVGESNKATPKLTNRFFINEKEALDWFQ